MESEPTDVIFMHELLLCNYYVILVSRSSSVTAETLGRFSQRGSKSFQSLQRKSNLSRTQSVSGGGWGRCLGLCHQLGNCSLSCSTSAAAPQLCLLQLRLLVSSQPLFSPSFRFLYLPLPPPHTHTHTQYAFPQVRRWLSLIG